MGVCVCVCMFVKRILCERVTTVHHAFLRILFKSLWTPLLTVDLVRTPLVLVVLALFGDKLWMCHLSEESTRLFGCCAQVCCNGDLSLFVFMITL